MRIANSELRITSCVSPARRTLAVFLAIVLTVALPVHAAAQEPLGPAIKVDVSLLLLEATVKDRSGRILKDLKQDDFLLDADGQPQSISHFSRDQLPLAVALVLDLSGSIEPFLRPLRYATLSALKSLKPEDQVALFTFTDNAELRVPLTRDKRDVSDQIENLLAGGSTNINQGLYDAAQYLRREAPAARRVIILISDNVATAASVNSDAVIEQALEADAAIYSIKVPGRNPPEAKVMAKLLGRSSDVRKMTSETGGEMFDMEKEGSLFLSLQTLIERLKTRYTIGFYPAQQGQAAGFHRINLRLHPSFGGKGHDYSVVTKTGYFVSSSRASSR